MDRRDREAILGEWGVRDPNAREQAGAALLDRDLEGSPLRGKPIQSRLRNFRPAVDRYVVSLGGPLPYMRRLRQIELETEQHEQRLAEARNGWPRRGTTSPPRAPAPAGFDRRWRALATRWRFHAVNDLIDRHNRWYPAEARLPMDPRTGDFVPVGGRPYRREPLDAGWILERFPPELALVPAA